MRANPVQSFVTACIAAFLSLLGGCAATSVVTVWKSAQPAPASFKNVLAMVTNTTPAQRRAGEDELVSQIKSAHAVASYTLIPDQDVRDKEKILATLQQHDFDGLVVLRLVSSDTTTTYVPPSYGSGYTPFGGDFEFYGYDAGNPGYTTMDTVVTSEISLYAVTAKIESLIWAGSATTSNPSNIKDLVIQISRASVEELKKQGILK